MKTFIKEEREKRKIQQKDLAEELNIAKSTLATYENTDRDPPLDILCKIADKFDMSLDMLIRGKEKDRPVGRSMLSVAEGFSALSDEHLEMLAQTAVAVLAERRFQAQQEKERKETE